MKKVTTVNNVCWQNGEIVGFVHHQTFTKEQLRQISEGLRTFLFVRMDAGQEQTLEVRATTPTVALAVLTDGGKALNKEFDDYRFWINGLTDKEFPTTLVRKTVTYTKVYLPKMQKVH